MVYTNKQDHSYVAPVSHW